MRISLYENQVIIEWDTPEEAKTMREKINELICIHDPTFTIWRMGVQIGGKAIKV